VWDNPATVVCGTCHGASNSADSAPDSGSHEKHADSDQTINAVAQATFNRNYECTLCHKDIVGGTGPSSYTIADEAKHVNAKVDWVFDITDSRLAIGTPGYSIVTGTEKPSDGTIPRAYGTCTVYCHSNVQPDGGVGNPDTYASPTWGSSVTCGNCHERDSHSAVGNVIGSGSHTDHLQYQFTTPGTYKKCDICHKLGTSPINVDECNSCHVENEKTLHVNGIVDMLFDSTFVGASASYNDGSGIPGEPGNGYFDCSNVYCHSTGQSTTDPNDATPTYASPNPTWGNAASGACGTCHKVEEALGLTSGSHGEHLGTQGVNGCGDCHTGAADDASSYNDFTKHVNKLIDVSNTYNAGGTPGNGYGTCSTASCHSNGLGSYKVSPVWGTSATGCNYCHNALPTSGAHGVHVKTAATAYGSTSSDTTGGNYDFGCGNCHPVDEPTYHRNNTLEITLNSGHGGTLKAKNNVSDDSSGYTRTIGVSVTCNAAYCHSNGAGSFGSSPEWYTQNVSGKCDDCHGNQPTTNNHGLHVVGIHYADIYTGSTGKATEGNGPTNSHGSSTYSTTINCHLCHSNTVTMSANSENSVCSACHTDNNNAAIGDDNMIIDAGSTVHVSGSPDIAFAAVTMKSKAQIRDDITTVTELNNNWDRTVSGASPAYKGSGAYDQAKSSLAAGGYSAGTCSSIVCHNGNSAMWNDVAKSCDYCHKEVTN
jgi:predicted CxxxxCH...CXXCH cytochrome family protein